MLAVNKPPEQAVDRNHALDGVRGYAAVVVVIFHSMLSLGGLAMDVQFHTPFVALESGHDLAVKLLMTLFHGDSAVVLFFILSGCVLIRTLERDFPRYGSRLTSVVFVLRRFLRIYPGLLVSLVGSLALWLLADAANLIVFPFSPVNIVRNFLLIAPEISAPTWTLIVEILAVPFLLAVGYLCFCRLGLRTGLALFVAFSLIVRVETWLLFDYSALYFYLIDFALGCLIPYAPGVLAARLGKRLGWIPLLVVFIGVRAFPIGFTIQPYIGMIFLSLVYHSPPRNLKTLLLRPVSQYLGRVSYGVYLWHYQFTHAWVALVLGITYLRSVDPLVAGLAGSIPVLAAAVVFGDLSERYIERPGVELGRKWSKWLIARSSASSPLRPEHIPRPTSIGVEVH